MYKNKMGIVTMYTKKTAVNRTLATDNPTIKTRPCFQTNFNSCMFSSSRAETVVDDVVDVVVAEAVVVVDGFD